ncbi:LpxI family protein [Rhodosalinus halophilus]|uniref:LpxI family protein n=1 Tax=Rhodosalinus halophilus TaxID=2259333 RepID=A0A365U8V6_9RHOB|nr:UDP-2,3-diacylglucosamine diphosphatase LpxI [Rhodosalinus halophilus]RBI85092.1 LpxI family protein [Rhodosalinus halophilus]
MLALIAGEGALPAAVAAAQTRAPLICALRGHVPEGLTPDITFRLETLGGLMEMLRAQGVTEVCLCGAIGRPAIDLGAIDDLTWPMVPRMREALQRGDDGALRVALELFEGEGFGIVAAHEAAPSLLPPAGVLTEAQPRPDTAAEADLGAQVVAEMGAADQGQACVIRGARVVAREQADGTDAMLARLAPPRGGAPAQGAGDPFSWAADMMGDMLGGAADWLSGQEAEAEARAGILYKAPKPDQDRRADLPTIGPRTVPAVAAAGLAGIVVSAGGVIVLDRAATVAACDRAGLFLWVRG